MTIPGNATGVDQRDRKRRDENIHKCTIMKVLLKVLGFTANAMEAFGRCGGVFCEHTFIFFRRPFCLPTA